MTNANSGVVRSGDGFAGTDFKEGDKVRVTRNRTLTQTWTDTVDSSGSVDLRGYGYVSLEFLDGLPNFTVELIERADDPAKDLVGTVRRLKDGSHRIKTAKANAEWQDILDPYTSYRGEEVLNGCGNRGASLIGSQVVGTVPGTPAWEAQRATDEAALEAGYEQLAEALREERKQSIGYIDRESVFWAVQRDGRLTVVWFPTEWNGTTESGTFVNWEQSAVEDEFGPLTPVYANGR